MRADLVGDDREGPARRARRAALGRIRSPQSRGALGASGPQHPECLWADRVLGELDPADPGAGKSRDHRRSAADLHGRDPRREQGRARRRWRDRRDRHCRRRARPRLSQPRGADAAEVHPRLSEPAEQYIGPHLSQRRPRLYPRRRARVPRPHRYAGQDPRLPHRARGDRGGAAAGAADFPGRGQSLRGGAGRSRHRGLLHPQAGCAGTVAERGVGDAAQESAALYGAGLFRGARRHPDDVEQQGGPQELAGPQGPASLGFEQQICRALDRYAEGARRRADRGDESRARLHRGPLLPGPRRALAADGPLRRGDPQAAEDLGRVDAGHLSQPDDREARRPYRCLAGRHRQGSEARDQQGSIPRPLDVLVLRVRPAAADLVSRLERGRAVDRRGGDQVDLCGDAGPSRGLSARRGARPRALRGLQPAADRAEMGAGRPLEGAVVPDLEPALFPLLGGEDADPQRARGDDRRAHLQSLPAAPRRQDRRQHRDPIAAHTRLHRSHLDRAELDPALRLHHPRLQGPVELHPHGADPHRRQCVRRRGERHRHQYDHGGRHPARQFLLAARRPGHPEGQALRRLSRPRDHGGLLPDRAAAVRRLPPRHLRTVAVCDRPCGAAEPRAAGLLLVPDDLSVLRRSCPVPVRCTARHASPYGRQAARDILRALLRRRRARGAQHRHRAALLQPVLAAGPRLQALRRALFPAAVDRGDEQLGVLQPPVRRQLQHRALHALDRLEPEHDRADRLELRRGPAARQPAPVRHRERDDGVRRVHDGQHDHVELVIQSQHGQDRRPELSRQLHPLPARRQDRRELPDRDQDAGADRRAGARECRPARLALFRDPARGRPRQADVAEDGRSDAQAAPAGEEPVQLRDRRAVPAQDLVPGRGPAALGRARLRVLPALRHARCRRRGGLRFRVHDLLELDRGARESALRLALTADRAGARQILLVP